MTLTLKDFEKFKRLEKTFGRNYRVTHLFARYLSEAPEAITADAVSSLVGDGFTEKEAIAALLSALFGLETDKNAEDRRLYLDYILPSVRILDARKYQENPYRKAVKINFAEQNGWTCKTETYPAFRGMICDDMTAEGDGKEIPPLGFFPEPFSFPAVLEDGNEWMTLSPVDTDTCEFAIEAAHGDVVTFGLGLGYYAFMVAEKPDVRSVTVIEKSPDVIELFRRVLLPQFPHKDKIRVIEADAFAYAEGPMRNETFDYAFVDTWRDASDGLPMYCRMKKCEKYHKNTEFSYWIEGFILSRLRAFRFEELRAYENADKTHTGAGAVGRFEDFLSLLSDEDLRRFSATFKEEP